VAGCDTLNALITEYRESRQIQLKIEQRYMHEMMPAYDPLSLLQKVEVFEHGLTSTAGNDLNRVLWLKSQNSEEWLEKRLTYTRSLAVTSMVGYILGLGDRHPSNIMLERRTGKLIHIDFGDCFEVAMLREKYPEKVPFRLTRMLVNALEASGIEGYFRLSCERVMQVLRDNKESLMAVLEAFVYDPLFNMRLLNTAAAPKGMESNKNRKGASDADGEQVMLNDEAEEGLSIGAGKKARLTQAGEIAGEDAESVTAGEVINEKALTVVARINRKLSGRDFGADAAALSVQAQVDRLITQASSVENLSCMYFGWMPFW
jgi:FKBP12-rapamycin complex-associated protein